MLGAHECTNTHRHGPSRLPPDTHAHTNNYCLLLSVCTVGPDSTASTWFMKCFIPLGLRLSYDPVFFFLVCPLFSPLQIQNVHTFSIHESFKCQLCWLISAEFLFAKVSRIKIYRLQFLSFFFSTNLEIKLKQKWDTGLLFQPRQF